MPRRQSIRRRPTQDRYILLSGPACAGKTTIGRWLSRHLGLPFLQRDDLMEIMFEDIGWRNRPWRRKLRQASYRIFYAYLEFLFRLHCPFIIESGFGGHQDHAAIIRRLQRRTGMQPIQIHCWTDFSSLEARHRLRVDRRMRHPGWQDRYKNMKAFRLALRRGVHQPLEIGGTLVRVDTTGPWRGKPELLRQVRAALGR